MPAAAQRVQLISTATCRRWRVRCVQRAPSRIRLIICAGAGKKQIGSVLGTSLEDLVEERALGIAQTESRRKCHFCCASCGRLSALIVADFSPMVKTWWAAGLETWCKQEGISPGTLKASDIPRPTFKGQRPVCVSGLVFWLCFWLCSVSIFFANFSESVLRRCFCWIGYLHCATCEEPPTGSSRKEPKRRITLSEKLAKKMAQASDPEAARCTQDAHNAELEKFQGSALHGLNTIQLQKHAQACNIRYADNGFDHNEN
jgi:hypothetical protein